jgi:nitrite reductase/ring-hydroxylating ferredoxin subunit
MSKHRVASTADFDGDGSRVIAEIDDGLEIAVFYFDGEYHALSNYCVHQGGPLCEGPVTGKMTVDESAEWEYEEKNRYIVCPWHEWKFDITTGKNVSDERYVTPKFEVVVEGDDVFVIR